MTSVILFFVGIVLLILFFVMGFKGDCEVWGGVVLVFGGLISLLVFLVAAFLEGSPVFADPEFCIGLLVFCGCAIAEFIWGIYILKEEGVGELFDWPLSQQAADSEVKTRLTNDVQKLKVEQEKILNKWKHSAYYPKSKDKIETKNEAETSDEDAYKK